MSSFKYFVLIFLLAATSGVRAGAGDPTPAEKTWLVRHPIIEVATYSEGFAPFEMERDGRIEGLAPNYLRELARRLGVEPRFKVYPTWDDALAAARAGEVDLLMNVTPTPERSRFLLFGQPYFEQMPVLVTRRDDANLTNFSDLNGRTVATQKSFVEAETIDRYMPDAKVIEAASAEGALRMVADGTADATIDDPNSARIAIDKAQLGDRLRIGPVAALPISTFGFAVPRDRDRAPLLGALDRVLGSLTAEEHARLRAPWVGGDPGRFATQSGVPFSDAERAWLARLPVLRIGIDPTAAPISMVDRDGHAEGIGADFLAEISHTLGLRTSFIATPGWAATRARVAHGDIDILPAVSPFGDALERPFDFSTPYLEFPIMIVTREDRPTMSGLTELANLKVAANITKPPVAAVANQLQHSTIEPVDSTAEGLAAVAEGRADAFIGDIATSEFIMRRDYPGRLKFAAPTGQLAIYAVGVSREYAPLLPLINRVLGHMSDRRTREIRNTWLSSEYTYGGSWGAIARKTLPALLLALALLATISYAYLRLRRETRKRMDSEAQLADVTHHIPAVVYRCRYYEDGRLDFLYVGGNPEPIFGIPAASFIADERLAFARIEPDDQPVLMAEVARAATTLTPIKAVMRIRDTDPVRWVASHAIPSEVEGAVDFTGYWVDVSHERQQAEQLAAARDLAESATRAKSEFLATMSHEIRTPMNGVIGMLELLGDTPLDARQRRMLGTVETSAAALLQILDDVLDVSRIEAGRLSIERTPVDLRALVRSVRDLLTRQADEKGLTFVVEVEKNVAGLVLTDSVRVRQILLNLVSNALKFTASGSVTVSLAATAESDTAEPAEKQRLLFCVADTGIGVTPEQAARLFEPFSQAESSTTRRYGGSGLGLAICRRLTDLLGGTIAMTSEPGRGTQVVVELTVDICPIGTVVAASHVTTPVTPRMADGGHLHVLVAEDNPINQALVAAQLQKLGHTSHVVANGVEALEAWSTGVYDVLVTDCHMPELDGYGLARAIREREAGTGNHLHIVAMTANALPDAEARCRAAGMDAYVAKPLRSAELQAKLIASAVPVAGSHADWDLDELLETFGDPDVLRALVTQFVTATKVDIEALPGLVSRCDGAKAIEWLHRVTGGMRVFGPSSTAAEGEALEHAFHAGGGTAEWSRLEAFGPRLELYLAGLARSAQDL
ncbi:multi-sensor hybrid histidine kinase [Luteibacter rhizovicinus]|uniref:Sensory/regulatory protein RpfC n=1 Tax=Luteibacter rhizovicinus TaxID=242606 RepID=A0A4R3YI73_9GAMM|nr:transporter substrate-binding domain-containing protein [Luteibacter rhizovicinus]TCV92047.1 multi-sensor hybrid histidine kinase [Luteibacter rhizovicinus]